MPSIYPQMPKHTADEKTALFETKTAFICEKYSSANIHGMYWQPLGRRVTEPELKKIKDNINQIALKFNYGKVKSISKSDKAFFDKEIMIWLRDNLDILPSEAGRPGVWYFFNISLFPHIVSWRWGNEKDGVYKINTERFLSRRRNYFGTLWWRAFFFKDEESADPYNLYSSLIEDDYVSLMERTSIVGYKPLMIAAAEEIVKIKKRTDLNGDTIRLIIRKAIISLRIHSSVHNLWVYSRDELKEITSEIFRQAENFILQT